MTPQRIEIAGRLGYVLYLNDRWEPVEPSEAVLARVLFDDGGTAFFRVKPM